jgi:hypothetical protein
MEVPRGPRLAGDGDELPNGDAQREPSTEPVEMREESMRNRNSL